MPSLHHYPLKSWMLESAKEEAYRLGQALATRKILPRAERTAYLTCGAYAIPDFVLGLSLEDHIKVYRTYKKYFRLGFRDKLK